MAMNVVTLVMQYLTPDMVGRIASVLGMDRGKTQSAIGAAVPGLLAGFSTVSARPDGAQRLADAVNQQSGMLSSFTNMLSSGGQALADKGSQMLSSLLGTREETALAGAVGTYAGMDRRAGDSLLGMLAPVVMGTIAQQQGGRNVDGRGIAGFFAGQRDSIAAALPSGFSNLLGGTGLLDSLGVGARASERAIHPSHPAVGAARQHPESASSAMSWLFWAVMAAAIAALLFYILRPAQNVVDHGAGTAQSVMVDGRNLGNDITSSMDMLRSTLTGITDVDSAQRALPRLQDIATQVDGVSNSMTQLTIDQRRVMRGMVSPSMQGLSRVANSAMGIPGVSDVIGPTLNGIMTKLRAIAG